MPHVGKLAHVILIEGRNHPHNFLMCEAPCNCFDPTMVEFKIVDK